MAITGAPAATYPLGDSDVGATIAVAVSYTDGGGTAEAVTSAAVGPVANVNRLRHRDLHMIHIAAVPDRLEDCIGEAEKQDVLSGFLTQVVINAKYLAFLEDRVDDLVQAAGGGQVVSVGFFNHDPPPASIL